MTAIQFIELLVALCERQENHEQILSIGHWQTDPMTGLPSFYADVKVELSEIKTMLTNARSISRWRRVPRGRVRGRTCKPRR